MAGLTMTELTSILFLTLLIPGNIGQWEWSVTYSPTHICALEGSSVNMSCSYTYPSNLTVTDAYWINQEYVQASDITEDVSYADRVRVNCGDKNRQCSLHMTKLTQGDTNYQYYCRITTNEDKEKWIGKPGIYLRVTALMVESSSWNREVKEGDHMTLTCRTTCILSGSLLFIWSKDGRPVKKNQIHNKLQLHPARYEDEGNYTCAVRGHEDRPSPPMGIIVKCQKVVSLSSSSARKEVTEGDNVTLTCSITNCHPSGSHSFFWSKDGHSVEKKIVSNQLQFHSISRENEGTYTCAIRGQEGLPSPPFRLQVTRGQSPVIAAVAGVAAVCGVVGLLCVICWLRFQKKNKNRTESRRCEDHKHDVQNSSINSQSSWSRSRTAGPSSAEAAGGAEGDVLYSTVQSKDSRQTADCQRDDVQYASVQFRKGGTAKSSPDQPEGEPSVIYSSLQMGVQM